MIIHYTDKMFSLPRMQKRIISITLDFLFLFFAYWLAIFVRFDQLHELKAPEYWLVLGVVCVVSIFVNTKLGLYRAVLRFLTSKTINSVVASVFTSGTTLFLFSKIINVNIPLSTAIVFMAFLLATVGGSRLIVRSWASEFNNKLKTNVLIYGAGSAGIQLVNALNKGGEYKPRAFIDDEPSLINLLINGLKVHKQNDIEHLIERHNIKQILLAIPSASKSKRSKVVNSLEKYPVEILAIPGMADLVSGKAKIDDFVEVSIDDLLGRDPVRANDDLLHADIKNKVVMVTGAGGSIGSELCRQIVNQSPKALLLFELTEFALYSIHRELEIYLKENQLNIKLYPLLGSVIQQERLEQVMATFKVQTVYHAAAYKHVPLVEHNVIEGVNNNIFGTLHCAQAAINTKVETFVLISTDKAVRPTNVMGTTKRMAELCLQALADKNDHDTRFCMVRFGNVLGSSGSVVPLFKAQIKNGGPITLTHKNITRYFMTIPEAAQLVIQAGAMGMGGDVFVLDMGEPVKIYDLAYKMIHLSGLRLKHDKNPNGDIEIIETGLRPGEKLYEELLIGDDVEKTGNERIMTASEVFLPWSKLSLILNELTEAGRSVNHQKIRELLLNAPTGFKPADDICDLVFLKNSELKQNH